MLHNCGVAHIADHLSNLRDAPRREQLSTTAALEGRQARQGSLSDAEQGLLHEAPQHAPAAHDGRQLRQRGLLALVVSQEVTGWRAMHEVGLVGTLGGLHGLPRLLAMPVAPHGIDHSLPPLARFPHPGHHLVERNFDGLQFGVNLNDVVLNLVLLGQLCVRLDRGVELIQPHGVGDEEVRHHAVVCLQHMHCTLKLTLESAEQVGDAFESILHLFDDAICCIIH
mmetsp:Transcript_55375/g.144419  ORF Transcript_55375/g.144419 Transcript_55375/m.144419 type:complete len:225 (+) Transcript_55375:1697-2371(+)